SPFAATATTEPYTLSLHDALPISQPNGAGSLNRRTGQPRRARRSLSGRGDSTGKQNRGNSPRRRSADQRCCEQSGRTAAVRRIRSVEHTSELQSRENLVCRLLLEK